MNTPTHLLIGATILARKGEGRAVSQRNWTVLVGSLLPDAAIFLLFGWARWVKGASEEELWSRIYWTEPWQGLIAIFNSVPLFCALALLGLILRQPLVVLLSLAALLHLAFDLPFHHDDAHPHFWPFTDWRFHSPVSYWDERYHGGWVSMVEAGLAIGLIVILWRRFESQAVRAALMAALVSYAAVPAYFNLMLN